MTALKKTIIQTALILNSLMGIKLLLFFLFLSCGNDSDQEFKSWSIYSGDASGSKYSNLSEVNKTNIGQLKLIWELEIYDKKENHRHGIQCNPIIIGDQMFVIGPDMKVHAINATQGNLNWSFDPFPGEKS